MAFSSRKPRGTHVLKVLLDVMYSIQHFFATLLRYTGGLYHSCRDRSIIPTRSFSTLQANVATAAYPLEPVDLSYATPIMQSGNPQSLGDASSSDDLVQMSTLQSTSTAWTQTTVWIVSGPVQRPETTEYSYLQPIEMASYPDPIMSATGTDLQSLLAQKHASSTSSISDLDTSTATTTSANLVVTDKLRSSAEDVTVIPVTYTTEYLTTTLITIYTSDKLLETPRVKVQPSPSIAPASTETGTPIQTSSEASTYSKSPTVNTVVPITIENPASSTELDLLGRDESLRNILSPENESKTFQNDAHIGSRSQSNITILIYILSAILITSVIVHLLLRFCDPRDSSDLSYTTKPPRPGLRKRLSLSISMTTGRRPSIVSTNSTEATYVSGNAVSIGKAGGKGFGTGSKETEVRRTPSTGFLEV